MRLIREGIRVTEIEASILINQLHILNALALLVPQPLREELFKRAEQQLEMVNKLNGQNNN